MSSDSVQEVISGLDRGERAPCLVEVDNLALPLARTRIKVVRLQASPDPPTVAYTRRKIDRISTDIAAAFRCYQQLVGADRERQTFRTLRLATRTTTTASTNWPGW
jgi:hypothetical protein